MKKYILLFTVVLFSAFAFAFAEEEAKKEESVLVASWMWKTEEGISAFRFKVNNDDPNFWDHIVDGSVTSYSIRNVKKGEKYTLYLQQSYDKEIWSDTAVSTITVQ